MNKHELELKLAEKVNDGFASLAKWLISLSSGIIVFSVSQISPGVPEPQRFLFISGLGLLFVTILSGVLYVRFGLDGMHYNYCLIGAENEIDRYRKIDSEDSRAHIVRLEKICKKQRKKFDWINKIFIYLIPIMTWTFIFGLMLIAVIAYFQMQ